MTRESPQIAASEPFLLHQRRKGNRTRLYRWCSVSSKRHEGSGGYLRVTRERGQPFGSTMATHREQNGSARGRHNPPSPDQPLRVHGRPYDEPVTRDVARKIYLTADGHSVVTAIDGKKRIGCVQKGSLRSAHYRSWDAWNDWDCSSAAAVSRGWRQGQPVILVSRALGMAAFGPERKHRRVSISLIVNRLPRGELSGGHLCPVMGL
jgi:hypothetical protein